MNPTNKQLERDLWQRLQALYFIQLGHTPSQVSYQVRDRTVTIVVEDSITKPVQLLAESGKQELAKQVQFNIHKAIQPQLEALIEAAVGVNVIELLNDFNLETGYTSIVAVLAAIPNLNESSSTGKVEQKVFNTDND